MFGGLSYADSDTQELGRQFSTYYMSDIIDGYEDGAFNVNNFVLAAFDYSPDQGGGGNTANGSGDNSSNGGNLGLTGQEIFTVLTATVFILAIASRLVFRDNRWRGTYRLKK
jgi:hypothetical protein